MATALWILEVAAAAVVSLWFMVCGMWVRRALEILFNVPTKGAPQ